MAREYKKALVWVVWSPNGTLENVYTLTFGNGEPRVYERNKYDSRCVPDGKVLPYFRTRAEAAAFLVNSPNELCQVDVRTRIF